MVHRDKANLFQCHLHWVEAMAAATPSPFFLWLLLVLPSVLFPSISSAAEFSLGVDFVLDYGSSDLE